MKKHLVIYLLFGCIVLGLASYSNVFAIDCPVSAPTHRCSGTTCPSDLSTCSVIGAGGLVLKDFCKLVQNIDWPGKYCDVSGESITCLNDDGQVITECKFAKDETIGGCDSSGLTRMTPDWGAVCMVNTINNVVNWLFFLMTTIAVLLFIIGAVYYMTAGGDPDKAKKGKGLIIYAIIGIVIALIAKMIPSLVTTIIAR